MPERVLIDANYLFSIFPITERRVKNYQISEQQKITTDIYLQAYELATKTFILELSNLLLWELCSIKKEKGEDPKAMEKTFEQMLRRSNLGELNIEQKLDYFNLGVACILGSIAGADIKDCYHYLYAIKQNVSKIITHDEDFNKIDSFFNEVSPKNIVEQIVSMHVKLPLLERRYFEGELEKRIESFFSKMNQPKVLRIEGFVEGE